MSRPIPFKIQKSKHHALLVQIDEGEAFYNQLHYHPEFQITAIVKGKGIFYGGNNVVAFEEKDVLLIGSNVPHLLKNSKNSDGEELGIKGISLFFDEYSFGKQFFELTELQNCKSILQESNRIIKVKGNLKEVIYQKICSTTNLKNEALVITFIQILAFFFRAKKNHLNSEQYNLILNEQEGGRLNEVLDFTFKNYHQEITIEQIAKIACLSRSQFSYFFKLHTNKTYIQFLNELRIENACIALKNVPYTIERICYEVGFKNVSNFVRQFKKVKNTTPSNYRKLWIAR